MARPATSAGPRPASSARARHGGPSLRRWRPAPPRSRPPRIRPVPSAPSPGPPRGRQCPSSSAPRLCTSRDHRPTSRSGRPTHAPRPRSLSGPPAPGPVRTLRAGARGRAHPRGRGAGRARRNGLSCPRPPRKQRQQRFDRTLVGPDEDVVHRHAVEGRGQRCLAPVRLGGEPAAGPVAQRDGGRPARFRIAQAQVAAPGRQGLLRRDPRGSRQSHRAWLPAPRGRTRRRHPRSSRNPIRGTRRSSV